MPNAISDSIRLYGTDETVEPPRILQAGPLTVEFDAGNLRHIRYHGREMIRAVSFVVRDKNWGTYAPQIAHLNLREEPEEFRISYEATVSEKEQEFRYSAAITGKSDGSLSFLRKRNGDIGFSHESNRLCRPPSDRGRGRRRVHGRARRWDDRRNTVSPFDRSRSTDVCLASDHA